MHGEKDQTNRHTMEKQPTGSRLSNAKKEGIRRSEREGMVRGGYEGVGQNAKVLPCAALVRKEQKRG